MIDHRQGQAGQRPGGKGETQTAHQDTGKQLTLVDVLQGEQHPVGHPTTLPFSFSALRLERPLRKRGNAVILTAKSQQDAGGPPEWQRYLTAGDADHYHNHPNQVDRPVGNVYGQQSLPTQG